MHHDLKLFAKYFQYVVDSKIMANVRENDRNFQIGDSVTFNEGQPGLDGFEYTGRSISVNISYIDDFGCQHGYVNLSLCNVGLLVVGGK